MAAKKYLKQLSGDLVEQSATVTSAGAGNDGDLVALDSTGRLDRITRGNVSSFVSQAAR